MTLEQGQLWKKGADYIRITQWARLSIEYKLMKDPETKEGTLHQLTKKEFCRFLKGAVLVKPEVTANTAPDNTTDAQISVPETTAPDSVPTASS